MKGRWEEQVGKVTWERVSGEGKVGRAGGKG
jgi:hypothetical protein